MLRHMFKLLWNRKKNNMLLTIEVIFSFLVLFIISSLLTTSIKNYMTPLGYDYHDIVFLNFFGKDTVNVVELKRQIAALTEVKGVCFLGFGGPYSRNDSWGTLRFGNASFNDVHFYEAEDDYAKILNMKMAEGRWFSREDDAQKYEPIIINNELKEKIFGNSKAAGKIWNNGNVTYKVVGVVEHYRKEGEFSEPVNIHFARMKSTSEFKDGCSFLIRTYPNTSVMFQEKLLKMVTSFNPNMIKLVNRMEDMRTNYIAPKVRQLVVFSTIGAFLVINVALGLFGVLWFSINHRKNEIGIRRALGADKLKIYMLITGEVIIITSLAIAFGCLFAIQVPLINIFAIQSELYLLGLIAAIIFIYIITALCSSYPGYLASKIEPAAALHDE